jgi:hypothetical protein
MTVVTANNATVSIGGALAMADPAQADFEALTFVPVGEVESIGAFGDKANIVNFTSLADGRVRKSKGARDAGNFTVVVGRDPEDSGQAAMTAAQATTFKYGIKIELADAPGPGWTNTIFYLKVIVASANVDVGANDHIVRINYDLGIDSEIVEVLPVSP